MKFSELAKYKTDTQLVISARHDKWMVKNGNPTYSLEALNFGVNELYKQRAPRDRRGTVSASSMGSCRRRQQFTFIGLAELPYSPKTNAIFQNGTFTHIRWQMAGITEGWLKEAEVPVPQNQFRLSGTMDGILFEDSIVEFKSINSNGFRGVLSFGPKEPHLYQGASYALATDREKVVFVYEDKDTQEYREIVMTRDELPLNEAEQSALITWESIDKKQLIEPLDSCLAGEGYQYMGCPFKDRCMKIKSWQEAEHLADQAA